MYSLISIIIWLIMGWISSQVAKQRGRNPITWFFIGMILGVIGLIILLIMPKKNVALATAPSTPGPIEVSVSPKKPETSLHETFLWYYLDEANKQYGPMSFVALKEAWNNDQINNSTYVWNEHMEKWQKIEDLSNLFAKMHQSPE